MIKVGALELNHRAAKQQRYTPPMTLGSCYYVAGIVSSVVGLVGLVGLVFYHERRMKSGKPLSSSLNRRPLHACLSWVIPERKGATGPQHQELWRGPCSQHPLAIPQGARSGGA